MISSSKRFGAVEMWAIPRVGTPAPAPDGSFFVVGVTTHPGDADESRERLYLVSHDGSTRPLTSPDVSSSQPVVSPDGKQLAFLRKAGGVPQLHVMPLDGGEARKITDLPLGAGDPRWLPDGRTIVVQTTLYKGALDVEATRRKGEELRKQGDRPQVTEDRVYRFWDRWLTDGEVTHLFAIDVGTGAARDLIPSSDRWFDLMDPDGEYDVSPDGREIVFSANVTQPPYTLVRWGIFTVPIQGGEARCITPDNPASDNRPRYSPDGRYIVHGAKRDILNYADRIRLVRIDRATGEHVTLTEGWDHSPSSWEFIGPDTLLIEVEERGQTSLYRMSVSAGGAPERVARGGALHGAKGAGDHVYAQHASITRPPEIARISLPSSEIERVTHFTDDAMSGFEMGPAEEIEFAGAGGETVHMFLVRPPGAPRDRLLPLVQMIHGGPYGMLGDLWHWRWNPQIFASHGYAVALVNFHGSAGYGERFANSVLADWGGKPAEDILLATDLLVARGIVDPKRMATAGGSYGGYMSCWLPTRTDRFACTVVHAPVYNTTTMAAGDVVQGIEIELGGEPWEQPRGREVIDRSNPAAHTGKYKTPTLITHGARDFRCTVQNGLELYGMLRSKGVPARLVHYPDENHWILKRRNAIHWYGEVLGWLQRHLS